MVGYAKGPLSVSSRGAAFVFGGGAFETRRMRRGAKGTKGVSGVSWLWCLLPKHYNEFGKKRIQSEGFVSFSIRCSVDKLVKLGFIEKERRRHDSTLYTVKGYVWYGSKSKPTLLGEAQSKETVLSPPESKASECLYPLFLAPPQGKDINGFWKRGGI